MSAVEVLSRRSNLSIDSAEAVKRAVVALQQGLGPDYEFLLCEAKPRGDDVAAFLLALPEDFTGVRRSLYVGFPAAFPDVAIRSFVEPEAWLLWPHVMFGKHPCLYGLNQKAPRGEPEELARDFLSRVRKLLGFVTAGSDPVRRNAEFAAEIESYWLQQLELAQQQVVLLGVPTNAAPLLALSITYDDGQPPRMALAQRADQLAAHEQRAVGRKSTMRANAPAGFYLPLLSVPPARVPAAAQLIGWLSEHCKPCDVEAVSRWLLETSGLPGRWLVLHQADSSPPKVHCFFLRGAGTKRDALQQYGRRAARHPPPTSAVSPSLQLSLVHVLDPRVIHGRDRTGALSALIDAHVLIVGAGSLGSSVAHFLARVGIGKLSIVDADLFADANIGRHTLGWAAIGRSKARSLVDKLQREVPTLEAVARSTRVQDLAPDFFKTVAVVVCTTADWWSESFLWRLRKETRAEWQLVQAWLEPHGLVGHILTSSKDLNADPSPLFDNAGNFKHKWTRWADDGVIALPGCGESFTPSGPLGVASLAIAVAEAVVEITTKEHRPPAWITLSGDLSAVDDLGGELTACAAVSRLSGTTDRIVRRGWPGDAEQ